MNFGLDLRPSLSRPTGIGTYVLGLLDRLPRLAPDETFHYFSASFRERYPSRDWPPNVKLVDRRFPVHALNFAWNRLEWPPLDQVVGAPLDLVHSPHPLLIPARKARRIVTVPDLFFLKHPELTAAEIRRDYVELVREHVKRADGVICISEYTKQETQRLLDVPSEKIAVTPLGVDPIFREPLEAEQIEATLSRLHLPRGAILYLGSGDKRKNLLSLVMTYLNLARRRPDVPPLVLAGPGSNWARGGDWVAPQIRATDYLPQEDVRALMAASSMLVLPSLEEGFGLPVVEAMAAGLPVVCSRGSALEEVAGDAATLVDPADPRALRRAIERLLDDPAEAESHREKGRARSLLFDWQDTAERTIAFYRTVLGR